MLRDLTASTLLDFARPEHRAGIEALADDLVTAFDRNEIARIYAAGGEPPRWTDRPDPWSFYSPEEIQARRQRGADEDDLEDIELEDDEDEMEGDANFLPPPETYVRATPKIGRNDPCPCGSGKKYKKCCLEKDDRRS
jgi:hypothetical protein